MLTTGRSVVERLCREDEGVCLLQTTEDKRHKRQLMAVRLCNFKICIITYFYFNNSSLQELYVKVTFASHLLGVLYALFQSCTSSTLLQRSV